MASLCKYVETHGPVKASALHVDADAYKRAVRKLTVTSLMHVPDAVLERQFKTMMHHLQHQDIQKIMHDKEEKKPSSTIILCLFSSKYNMNDGIEMVMQAISVGSVKFSVESVVESLVSHHENLFGPYCNADELTMFDELQVSVNGPPLNCCDSIVKLALDSYFTNHWHFLTNGNFHGVNYYGSMFILHFNFSNGYAE